MADYIDDLESGNNKEVVDEITDTMIDKLLVLCRTHNLNFGKPRILAFSEGGSPAKNIETLYKGCDLLYAVGEDAEKICVSIVDWGIWVTNEEGEREWRVIGNITRYYSPLGERAEVRMPFLVLTYDVGKGELIE